MLLRPQALDSATLAANRRGIWAAAPAPLPVVVAPTVPAYPAPVPDGPVAYLGDQPTAVVDAEQAFFVFGGAALGWGYWDHARRWHSAPDRYARQLERLHPDGRLGLGQGGFGLGEAGRAGFVSGAGLREEHGGFAPDRGRAGPAFARPSPGIGRPGLASSAGRPALLAAAPRPAMPTSAPRPAPPSGGGRRQ